MLLVALALSGLLLSGCQGEQQQADLRPAAAKKPALPGPTAPSKAPGSSAPRVPPRFANVATQAGIDFTYFNDPVPDRYFLPEVMGGGAAWLDFDGDGWLDLYLMNGCQLADADPQQTQYINRLYRNLGDGQFQEIAHAAKAGHNGYGQGCAVGDFDADGFPDLYLTNYGPNALLRNNGDGTFADVTRHAGVGEASWGTSAIWLDVDDDRDLDLYVLNYLDVTLANSQVCEYNGVPGYCGPGKYEAVPNLLYLNQGDGTFVESSESLGMVAADGKGLAVVAVDFDQDLRAEIYVANDMVPNFLFSRSQAHGMTAADDSALRYTNFAAAAGCAVSDSGQNEASMGISCADFDGDGLADLFLTHFYRDKNTLYHNLGSLCFQDDSRRTRVAASSFDTLGFGTVPLDYNQDGAMDLFITNGHVLGPKHTPNEMRPQLLHNDGSGRFEDVSDQAGPYFQDLWLGRGAAGADYDQDGDWDLLVTHLNRPVALLRNETETGRHFLGLELRTPSRLYPVGGRVVVSGARRQWTMPVTAGGSYLCSGDPRLVFGLGDEPGPVRVEVFWPSGRVDSFPNLGVDRYWRIIEGGQPALWPPTDRQAAR